MVRDATYKLFDEYRNCKQSSNVSKSNSENEGSISLASAVLTSDCGSQGPQGLMNRFKRFKNQSGSSMEKTELDIYLREDVEDKEPFDILQWWIGLGTFRAKPEFSRVRPEKVGFGLGSTRFGSNPIKTLLQWYSSVRILTPPSISDSHTGVSESHIGVSDSHPGVSGSPPSALSSLAFALVT
nr:zinc finger BED domain-containing protein RICESLEEPER 2-like [Ipomoea batatas]